MGQTPEIIGVGHNCLDYLCIVEDYPPEDGSTHITSITAQGGGAAATAVAAASRLGARTAVLGYLGDDETGRSILEQLQRDGVETKLIRAVPGGRSSVSYIMVYPPHSSRTKFPYPDQLPPIPWDEEQVRVIRQARIVHLDGTKYDNALAAAKIARQAGVLVSLDGCHMERDNEKNRALASMADILIMNAKYPTRVSGVDDFEKALLEISSWGPRVVAGTRGDQGCFAVIDGRIRHFPAFPVQAVDTTGAGDVFHGAFLAGWLRGFELEDNFRFAAAVSALKCTEVGGRTGIPTFDQTMEFLLKQT